MQADTVLVLLNLTAAFDTVDHTILQQRLEDWVEISGTLLNWFKSYLEDRRYYVEIGNWVSDRMSVICKVPQGSICDPYCSTL